LVTEQEFAKIRYFLAARQQGHLVRVKNSVFNFCVTRPVKRLHLVSSKPPDLSLRCHSYEGRYVASDIPGCGISLAQWIFWTTSCSLIHAKEWPE
jgi:hypothetical protein